MGKRNRDRKRRSDGVGHELLERPRDLETIRRAFELARRRGPSNGDITRHKLAKARFVNLVRLALSLGVHGCACGSSGCARALVEAVARAIQ